MRGRAAPHYVVGIGASAGGLEAIERFFDNVPLNCGLSFVLVQHLSPDFKSLMDELLARHTKIAIHRVQHGMPIERDAIYLIPPKTNMMLSDGRLWLSDQEPKSGPNLPIDIFLRSLAQSAGNRAIGGDPLRDRQRRIQGGPRGPREGGLGGRPGPRHGRVRRHAQGGDRHGRRRPRPRPGSDAGPDPPVHRAIPTAWRLRITNWWPETT